MSTLPFLLSLADELDSLTNTHSYLDDFGLGFYPHRHYHRTPSIQLSLPANTNWLERHRSRRTTEPSSASAVGRDGFQVCMDVHQFKPEEVSTRTVDNCVLLEGKHDQREEEHDFISRQYAKRYNLPKVKLPPPPADALESNERSIQIRATGRTRRISSDMDKSSGRQEDLDKDKDDLEEEDVEKE